MTAGEPPAPVPPALAALARGIAGLVFLGRKALRIARGQEPLPAWRSRPRSTEPSAPADRVPVVDEAMVREARDPATPGERLREMTRWCPPAMQQWNDLIARGMCYRFGYRSPELKDAVATLVAVRASVIANPSVPLDLLWEALRLNDLTAWHNPALSRLMAQEPQHDYRRMASLMLWDRIARDLPPALGQDIADRGGKWPEALVSALAELAASPQVRRRRDRAAMQPAFDLARRIAFLFGLPWSNSPPPVPPALSLHRGRERSDP